MTFVLNDNSLSLDQDNHIILSVTPINGFNNVPYMFSKKKITYHICFSKKKKMIYTWVVTHHQ